MNKTIALSLFALLAGCTPNPGPIRLVNFYDPQVIGCAVPKPTDQFLYAGELDVAGGAEFYLGALVESILNTTAGQSGDLALSNGTILEAAGRDEPIVDSIVVSYASKPKLTGFKDYSIPVHVHFDTTAIPAQASLGAFNIMGLDAANALDAMQPSTDPADAVDLTTTIAFTGYMSRQGNRITTGPNTFPIHVTRSTITCPKDFKRAVTCVYPGQIKDVANYCCACLTFGSAACSGTDGKSTAEPGCF